MSDVTLFESSCRKVLRFTPAEYRVLMMLTTFKPPNPVYDTGKKEEELCMPTFRGMRATNRWLPSKTLNFPFIATF